MELSVLVEDKLYIYIYTYTHTTNHTVENISLQIVINALKEEIMSILCK